MYFLGICLTIIGIKAFSTGEPLCIELFDKSWNISSEAQNLAYQVLQDASRLPLEESGDNLIELQKNRVFEPLSQIPHTMEILNRILIALFRCDQSFINKHFKFIEGGPQQQELAPVNIPQQARVVEAPIQKTFVPLPIQQAPQPRVQPQAQVVQAQAQPIQFEPQVPPAQDEPMFVPASTMAMQPTNDLVRPEPMSLPVSNIPLPPPLPARQVPVMYVTEPPQVPVQVPLSPRTMPAPPAAPVNQIPVMMVPETASFQENPQAFAPSIPAQPVSSVERFEPAPVQVEPQTRIPLTFQPQPQAMVPEFQVQPAPAMPIQTTPASFQPRPQALMPQLRTQPAPVVRTRRAQTRPLPFQPRRQALMPRSRVQPARALWTNPQAQTRVPLQSRLTRQQPGRVFAQPRQPIQMSRQPQSTIRGVPVMLRQSQSLAKIPSRPQPRPVMRAFNRIRSQQMLQPSPRVQETPNFMTEYSPQSVDTFQLPEPIRPVENPTPRICHCSR